MFETPAFGWYFPFCRRVPASHAFSSIALIGHSAGSIAATSVLPAAKQTALFHCPRSADPGVIALDNATADQWTNGQLLTTFFAFLNGHNFNLHLNHEESWRGIDTWLRTHLPAK